MGNKATGGPFAPLVVVVRNIVGDKEFNKLRGKAISLHSQGQYSSGSRVPAAQQGQTVTVATCMRVKSILRGDAVHL